MNDKDSLKTLFTMLKFMAVMSALTFSIFSIHSYFLHLPKEIKSYKQVENSLFFSIQKTEYELILPEKISLKSNDKLSIALISEHIPNENYQQEPMYIRYRTKPIDHYQPTEVNFFVNDNSKYSLKDNIILKIINKDSKTGMVSETLFK